MRAARRGFLAVFAALVLLAPPAMAEGWRWPTDASGTRVPENRFPCREPRLGGQMLPPMGNPPAACGIALPVRVTRVAGVALSQPITLSCPAARRFAYWADQIARPVTRRIMRSPLAMIEVSGGYQCRRVNFAEDGPLSQHAFGRAVDIAGFRLADGRVVRVMRDWGQGDAGLMLERLHAGACTMFPTVLGPAADVRHRDHFHFDIKPARRPYCR